MNENILQREKTWSQFSFDEKITFINRLNDQRRNEIEKKRTAKNRKSRVGMTAKKHNVKVKITTPKMSKTAQSLFDSLPDNIRKGFL